MTGHPPEQERRWPTLEEQNEPTWVAESALKYAEEGSRMGILARAYLSQARQLAEAERKNAELENDATEIDGDWLEIAATQVERAERYRKLFRKARQERDFLANKLADAERRIKNYERYVEREIEPKTIERAKQITEEQYLKAHKQGFEDGVEYQKVKAMEAAPPPHICENCGRNRQGFLLEGLPELPIEHVEGRGPGWKCTCGWWNWIPPAR